MLTLISLSCLNRPRRSRTVVGYLLQFIGTGYLDRSITSSYFRFRFRPKLIKTVSVGLYDAARVVTDSKLVVELQKSDEDQVKYQYEERLTVG